MIYSMFHVDMFDFSYQFEMSFICLCCFHAYEYACSLLLYGPWPPKRIKFRVFFSSFYKKKCLSFFNHLVNIKKH